MLQKRLIFLSLYYSLNQQAYYIPFFGSHILQNKILEANFACVIVAQRAHFLNNNVLPTLFLDNDKRFQRCLHFSDVGCFCLQPHRNSFLQSWFPAERQTRVVFHRKFRWVVRVRARILFIQHSISKRVFRYLLGATSHCRSNLSTESSYLGRSCVLRQKIGSTYYWVWLALDGSRG